jgi:hypothetical protein
MKNTYAIITNHSSNEFAATNAASETKVLPVAFAPKTKRYSLLVNVVLWVFLSLSLTSGQAIAASFTVNLNTDAHDVNAGNGVCDSDLAATGAQCTLRAAIEETNALAGIDFISFSLALPNTINLTIGELSIVGSVGIDGPGARSLTVQRAAGAAEFRIFTVQAINTSVAISSITIANGQLSGAGAGIQNQSGSSSLNLTDVTIRNNSSLNGSGGIINRGVLNIMRSTISGNTGVQGGGIVNTDTGILYITNSTISGNAATPNNSSNAPNVGGGIINRGAMSMVNVTISNNTASGQGGGFYNDGGLNSNFRNTIIAGNTAGSGNPDIFGTATSQGNNLIGISSGSNGFTNGINGDKVGTNDALLNAMLGALQNNGGQTDTHALLSGSPAIDAGNNCVADPVPTGCLNTPLTTDQRGTGFPRKVDGDGNGTSTVDIGAFERILSPTAAEVSAGGRIRTVSGKGIVNVKVMVMLPSGEMQSTVSGAGGYYQFTNLPAGGTYIFNVVSKIGTFPPKVVTINQDVTELDLISEQ